MMKIIKFLAVAVAVSAVVAPPVIGPASAQQVAAMSTQDWYQRIESTRKRYQSHQGQRRGAVDHPWVAAEIKAIDVGAGRMTISHGPIPKAKLPAMTMTFPVKDPSDLSAHEVGDHVQIQVADDGGVIKIVHVRIFAQRP